MKARQCASLNTDSTSVSRAHALKRKLREDTGNPIRSSSSGLWRSAAMHQSPVADESLDRAFASTTPAPAKLRWRGRDALQRFIRASALKLPNAMPPEYDMLRQLTRPITRPITTHSSSIGLWLREPIPRRMQATF